MDLINERNGFATDNMTKEYMVEQKDYLYNNKEMAKEMGVNSYKIITGEFSFDSYNNSITA